MLILLLAVPAICSAQTTWYVPDDFSTIQAAIGRPNVLDGDTVIVRPGTYVENIDFLGKAITLRSESGPDVTVIDGNYMDSVVIFQSGEGADSVLNGFTITKGYCGINCYESSPTITNTTITKNLAIYHGAGINCIYFSSPTITNTTITGNSADYYGGGIYCYDRSSPTITNATITGNSAHYFGGGVNCFLFCKPTFTNSILWDNYASSGQEIWIGETDYISTFTISYSDVKGGLASVYVAPKCTLNWGSGMIDADPLFVVNGSWDDNGTPSDPEDDFWVEGDYHLTFNSPCKNMGNNLVVTESYDYEGDPRISYGTVDMGADEFYPHLYYTGDATPSGTIQAKFVGLPGTLVNGVILGVNIFDPPLPCAYGLWYMDDPMQIIIGLGSIPSSGVAVLPGTFPSTPPAPYTIYLQAAIDSWLANLCTVTVQ